MRVMELHSPVRLVQRSKGHSATAAAAYRSGSRIACERTGEVHDYTRKQGIEQTALLFPFETPEEITDRASLWNAAEKREKHPRAQTARDLEVAFPSEFNAEQRREAGLLIGNYLVDNYGVAADLCWHKPPRKGDERNHHLHALFTTRRFEQGDWAKNKDRVLDDLKGQGAEEIIKLRQGVAAIMNGIAARDGLEIYVEHLSFEKRGVDREATQHLGNSATELERRGVKTDIGDRNRAIQDRNAQRERLHVEQKAVITEIKQAKQEARGQGSQTGPQIAQDGPQTPSVDWRAVFYRETQSRRKELLQAQEQQYGQQEQEAQQQLTQLFNTASQARGIFRFWRNITGRTLKDEQEIEQLQANLVAIQKRKQADLEAFERDRQNRLEFLKTQEAEQSELSDRGEEVRESYLERRQQQRKLGQDQDRPGRD